MGSLKHLKKTYLTACGRGHKEKQRVMFLAAVSGAPVCRIPRNGDVSFISRLSQKFLSGTFGLLQIYLILFCNIICSLKWTW